jgi:hypothetical protein
MKSMGSIRIANNADYGDEWRPTSRGATMQWARDCLKKMEACKHCA